MNSFDDLVPECLGHAGVVYEHVLVGPYTVIFKLQCLCEVVCVSTSENRSSIILIIAFQIKIAFFELINFVTKSLRSIIKQMVDNVKAIKSMKYQVYI